MLLNFRLQNSGWPLQGCVFVGCTDDEVEVALCRAVPFLDADDDCSPPVRYVTDTDVADATVAPEDALEAAMEVKSWLMEALAAVDTDKILLVEL
jgi:hypothetical protein